MTYGHPCSKAGDVDSKSAWRGSIPRGLALLLAAVMLGATPRGHFWRPWFTDLGGEATTGPIMEPCGGWGHGKALYIFAPKVTSSAVVLVLGAAPISVPAGGGKMIARPDLVLTLVPPVTPWKPVPHLGNGVLQGPLKLTGKAPAIYMQLWAKVGATWTPGNAVRVQRTP